MATSMHPARTGNPPTPMTVSLQDLENIIPGLAARESVLVIGPPGCGKSEVVRSAAARHGLDTRSLLGTQVAPEDISGIPSIRGERTVFHPPRLLFGDGRPYCLLLDDLPESPPDVQKCFYSLLLERRIGEHPLPEGTWVVANGRIGPEFRTISSALINRVFVIHVLPELSGWLSWAERNSIHPWIREYLSCFPGSLARPDPELPVPHSTPRSWSLLSRDLSILEEQGKLDHPSVRRLAFGRLSPEDAGVFATWSTRRTTALTPEHYLSNPREIPRGGVQGWLAINSIRGAVACGRISPPADEASRTAQSATVNAFFRGIPAEYRASLLVGLVGKWATMGLADSMWREFATITGTHPSQLGIR